MLEKKLEALERRLFKMMAKDEASKAKYSKAHSLAKDALDSANEGNHHKAYQAMTQFNSLMNEYKLNGNV